LVNVFFQFFGLLSELIVRDEQRMDSSAVVALSTCPPPVKSAVNHPSIMLDADQSQQIWVVIWCLQRSPEEGHIGI
jgi:hypothetical protein